MNGDANETSKYLRLALITQVHSKNNWIQFFLFIYKYFTT